MKTAQLHRLSSDYRQPIDSVRLESLLRSELADWLACAWFYPEGFELQRLSETPSHFVSIGAELEYIFPKSYQLGETIPFAERWQRLCNEYELTQVLAPHRIIGVRLLRWIDGELRWLDDMLATPLPPSVPHADEVALVCRRVFDGSRVSDVLSDDGELSVNQLDTLITQLVDFHRKMQQRAERDFSSSYVHISVFEPLKDFIDEYGSYLDLFSRIALREIQQFLQSEFADSELVFRQRSSAGCVSASHGNLRAHQIVLTASDESEIAILGASGTHQDLLVDLATLVVDLELYDAQYLAQELVHRYQVLLPELFDERLFRFYRVVQGLRVAIEAFDAAGADRTARANQALGRALRLALNMPQSGLIITCGTAVDEAQSLAETFAELFALPYLSAATLREDLATSILSDEAVYDRFHSWVGRLSEERGLTVAHWCGSREPLRAQEHHHLRSWIQQQQDANPLAVFRLIRCDIAADVSTELAPQVRAPQSQVDLALQVAKDVLLPLENAALREA